MGGVEPNFSDQVRSKMIKTREGHVKIDVSSEISEERSCLLFVVGHVKMISFLIFGGLR